jgi:hypothetical protein
MPEHAETSDQLGQRKLIALETRLDRRIAELDAERDTLMHQRRRVAKRLKQLGLAQGANLYGLGDDAPVLRGSRLREEAVRMLVGEIGVRTPIHYREWYLMMRRHGFLVPGKRPLSAFLTTVSRSAVVARGDAPGMYVVDPTLVEGLTTQLADVRDELRRIERHVGDHGRIASSALRMHRQALIASAHRLERRLAEANRALAAEKQQEPAHIS